MHRIKKKKKRLRFYLASQALQTPDAADFRFLLQNLQNATRRLGHENPELVFSLAGPLHEENPVDAGIAGTFLPDARNAVQNDVLASGRPLVNVADVRLSVTLLAGGVFQILRHDFLQQVGSGPIAEFDGSWAGQLLQHLFAQRLTDDFHRAGFAIQILQWLRLHIAIIFFGSHHLNVLSGNLNAIDADPLFLFAEQWRSVVLFLNVAAQLRRLHRADDQQRRDHAEEDQQHR